MAIGYALSAVVPSIRASAKTLLVLCALFPGLAAAMPVKLENATATFSQGAFGGGPYTPDQAIDGSFSPGIQAQGTGNGWAIDQFPCDCTTDETAVFETHTDVGQGPHSTLLTFNMYFLHWNPGHLLGHFRLSVTTDDRSTFADGLPVGGDVTANWIVLTELSVEGPAGMTFEELPDGSVLAGGVVPGQGVYEITALTDVSRITGIRLEALKDPSLPGDGPGLYPNGNVMLTEITLDAHPASEPIALALLCVAFVEWASLASESCY